MSKNLVQREAGIYNVSGQINLPKCKLCRLYLGDMVTRIKVTYGPAGKYAYEGNPLAALKRDVYICTPCATIIATVINKSAGG